ncbi:hypothetical protein RQP46_009997 [Phenoliferia psychrophenolica]
MESGSAMEGSASFEHLTKRKLQDALSSLDQATQYGPHQSPKKPRAPRRERETVSTPALVQLLAASRPLVRPAPVVPASYDPTSLPALLARIASFRLSSYSPKPAALAPPACALLGWTNESGPNRERERVECVTCHRGLLVTPPTQKDGGWAGQLGKRLEAEYAAQLSKDAHEDACPWRMRACARALYRCKIEGRGKLVEELVQAASEAQRKTGGAALADIRLKHPLGDDELANVVEAVQDYLKAKGAAVEVPPPPALVLALFGWTAAATSSATSPVLTCTLCTREVLITSHLPPSPSTSTITTPSTSAAFDVVSQHQHFCPFVDSLPAPSTSSSPAPTPASSSQALRKRNGWQARLDTLTKRPRRASSVVAPGGQFSWPSDGRASADPNKPAVSSDLFC